MTVRDCRGNKFFVNIGSLKEATMFTGSFRETNATSELFEKPFSFEKPKSLKPILGFPDLCFHIVRISEDNGSNVENFTFKMATVIVEEKGLRKTKRDNFDLVVMKARTRSLCIDVISCQKGCRLYK